MAAWGHGARQFFFALACLMGGCLCNVLTLEKIISHPSGRTAGMFITFAQFVFISIEGCISMITYTPKNGLALRPRRVPLRTIGLLVMLFWAANITNNIAFSYRISVPLNTVFRSLQLLTSMVLGFAILGKSYNMGQVLSVVFITLGVLLATLSSAATKVSSSDNSEGNGQEFMEWLTGIAILLFSILLSSLNGLVQEAAVKKIPRGSPSDGNSLPQWKELMVFTHLLGLPGFLLFAGDLWSHLLVFLQHSSLMWLLTANMITQWLCISGVLSFTELTDALTLTMAITARKMVSLFLSTYFFGNVFTLTHWAAAALAFGGGLLYTLASQPTSKSKLN